MKLRKGLDLLLPTDLDKQQTVREYLHKYDICKFIETGTYLGAMVAALLDDFKNIISIELSNDLYERAKTLFTEYQHVTILQGDSGVVLTEVLKDITEPCLFWLDAHYSKDITARGDIDTPIMKELEEILNHKIKNHVILIDDARLFDVEQDYPSVAEVQSLVDKYNLENNSNYTFELKSDIMRIVA